MASLRKDMEVGSPMFPAHAVPLTKHRSPQEWVASLPSHLQFTEENLDTQVAMFDTSSTSGAWCYCFMHAMHPCCYLAVREVRRCLPHLPDVARPVRRKRAAR